MHRRIRSSLTYANVMATIAVFLALGGGAYAAATIGSAQVINDSLRSVDINNADGVRSADVRDDNLTNGGLVGADIIESSLGKVGDANTVDGLDSTDLRGQQGPPGVNWRGDWSAEATYLVRDAVAYQGSSYIAVEDSRGVAPGESKEWNLLAQQGDAGSPAAGGGLFSGRVEDVAGFTCLDELPSCSRSRDQFGSPSGQTTATSPESNATFLSPNVDLTASDLAVGFTSPPDCTRDSRDNNNCLPNSDNQRTVTLRVNGADTALTCTVQGPQSSCNSGAASVPIPAASLLSIEVTGTLPSLPGAGPKERAIPGTDVLFGWKAVESN